MAKQIINRFIWPFQTHFRLGAEYFAKSVFGKLSDRIKCEIFLVGFLEEKSSSKHAVCVEPENGHWLLPDHLTDVETEAAKLQISARESWIFHTLPEAQQAHKQSIHRRSLIEATRLAVNSTPGKPVGNEYFVSLPVSVNGYSLMVILGLNSAETNAYPGLKIDTYWLHDSRSQFIPTSLATSTTEAFLSECSMQLLLPNPGETSFGGSTQSVLEEAASQMVCGLAKRADSWQNTLCSEQQVHSCLVQLAGKKYESTPARGKIVLACKDHHAIRPLIRFNNPIPLTNTRGIRKLLELTTDESLYLHTNSTVVWALAEISRNQLTDEDETLFEIEFLDTYVWRCKHNSRVLLQIENGIPRLTGKSVDRRSIKCKLLQSFPNLADGHIRHLSNLIETAADQKHGTMVVVTAAAENESVRLAEQSTIIEKSMLDDKLIKAVSRIDGAILCDTEGHCHAIGVILDGMATKEGDSARGARFNSAVRYVYSQKSPCIAFVVSEDGGVDVVEKTISDDTAAG